MDQTTVINSLEFLHPKFQPIAVRLSKALTRGYESGATKTRFDVFETYRTPMRQAYLLTKGTTKAKPFHSAHGFGFAVDLVPRVNGKWTWDVPRGEWEYLRQIAESCGALVPLTWDKCHVEHPDWPEILRKISY